MVRNNHHCAKSIKARCSDLENIKNELDRKVNRRKINLDKSAEIHECLQQVCWLNSCLKRPSG